MSETQRRIFWGRIRLVYFMHDKIPETKMYLLGWDIKNHQRIIITNKKWFPTQQQQRGVNIDLLVFFWARCWHATAWEQNLLIHQKKL